MLFGIEFYITEMCSVTLNMKNNTWGNDDSYNIPWDKV